MSNLLDLDFVSHISLVDDPAVPDAKFLVMKRNDPGEEVTKAGRTISQSNLQRLEGILEQVQNGRIGAAQSSLEAWLSEVADEQQLEQSSTLQNLGKSIMSDNNTDIDTLTAAIKEAAAEGIQEGLQEADLTGESGDKSPEGDDTPAWEQRIAELEDRLDQYESSDSGADGGDGATAPDDDMEKRIETLEKALEQEGRRGVGTSLDSSEEADEVAKNGVWSFSDTIQKAKTEGGD